MCGIAGYVLPKKAIEPSIIQSMTKVLEHRGPDGEGIYISDNEHVALGHRRLSFLDLSASGQQPMKDRSGKYVLSFNGEIYNYVELKKELESEGMSFQTHSDSEVVLNAYIKWGSQMLNRLKGMFAFAIYDQQKEELFLARDRFGIKPLFYSVGNEYFAFASEIKSFFECPNIQKKIRRESVARFLANRYVPSPHTIWEHILQLPPAHFLIININTLDYRAEQYWQLEFNQQQNDQLEAEEKIHQLLKTSVTEHLRSDVPLGSFLSGGMDSSLMVLLMKETGYDPIDTFTIGFQDWEQSEHLYARKVADHLNVRLTEQYEQNFSLDSVKHLMYHYDNPIADISILPTFSVSKLARQKVKAVLSGEGADECFGGYWWQQPEKFFFKNRWEKWKSKWKGISFSQIKEHYIQANSMGLFDSEELQKTFTPEWQQAIPDDPFQHMDRFQLKNISTLKQIQYLDLNLFMSELVLVKIDRATMANSLEARVPFLDHHLVEYIFSLHESVYFEKEKQKKILRGFLKGKVPSIIYERKKQGFVGPDKFYENIPVYEEKLRNGKLIKDGVIRTSYVHELVQNKDHWRLWKLFVLENWWEVWMS